MNKDLYTDSYEKNIQKFPTRISSKVPVNIALHTRNNSTGNSKPIAIKSLSNKTDGSISSSYHSFFGYGQTPSNSSISSSLTTQKTYLNNNTELQLSLKFENEEEVESKEKKEINQNNEFGESVTLGILNSEEYTRKLIRASRESFIFDYEKDYKDLSTKFNDSKDEDEDDDTKTSNIKNDKSYNKLYSDLDFNPNDSPIIIPGKPSNDVIDYSKNLLFKHSNSSNESLSSSSSYEHSNKVEIKRRVSNRKTGKRDINNSDNEEFSFFNNQNENQNKSRSYSLPRRIDIKKVENNRSRSNTLPRSMINSPTKDELLNSSSSSKDIYSFYDMIISPAKDEKFFVCTSPKKDAYNLYDFSTPKNIGIDKNNYNLYEDDDMNSFVYSQFDLISPLACDFNEYRNILKSKNTETSEKNEERKYRSLSRSTHGSLYRSSSRNGEMKETSEDRRKSRSRSRSRSLSRSRSRSKHRENSTSRNSDGEGKYHSLSRTKSDREKEHRESRSKERKSREHRESRSKNKEHRESRSKNKEHRDSRIKDKEHRESKSKEKRHSSSRHRRSSHTHKRNKSSSNDSFGIKNSPALKNSPISRKNSKNSNYGSPLVRSNSRSSPLASNVINNKFSTSYIQDHEGKNTPSTKLIDLTTQKKTQLPFDNMKNENNKFITIGESKNMEILNEISDLKKFSQEFSGLTILESILNRPIEDDNYDNLSTYDRLTYNSPSAKFSTIGRLPSQTNKSFHDLKRRNSDIDFPIFEKSHNRTNSDRSRNMQESKGNKKNIFNFFSNHKKSKSYSSLPSEKSFSNNSSNNSGKYSNNYDKTKFKQSNKISIRDDDSDSDINNSEYASSYINFLNETKKNTNFILPNSQPLNNIKDYTPLFKINHMNQLNTVNYFGSKGELVNPYDQFNDFDFNDNSRIENNKRPIMNQKMSSSYSSQAKGFQLGNKRY